jgi:hypothetical protein
VAPKLGFVADDYGYALDLGLLTMDGASTDDPEIEAGALWVGEKPLRRNVIAQRTGPSAQVQTQTGRLTAVICDLAP